MTYHSYSINIEPLEEDVVFTYKNVEIARSKNCKVLHETRLPGTCYVPMDDVNMDFFERSGFKTFCPFKGNASYFHYRNGEERSENMAWVYKNPIDEAYSIKNHLAFYSDRVRVGCSGLPLNLDQDIDESLHANPFLNHFLQPSFQYGSFLDVMKEFLWCYSNHLDSQLVRMRVVIRSTTENYVGYIIQFDGEGNELKETYTPRDKFDQTQYKESPLRVVIDGLGGVRRPLIGKRVILDYPVLEDLQKMGATDYVAMPLHFSDSSVQVLTLATKAPTGFSIETLGYVFEVLPVISRMLEINLLRNPKLSKQAAA